MNILIKRLEEVLLSSSSKIKEAKRDLKNIPWYRFKERRTTKDYIKLEQRFMRNIINKIQKYDNK